MASGIKASDMFDFARKAKTLFTVVAVITGVSFALKTALYFYRHSNNVHMELNSKSNSTKKYSS